MWPSTSDFGNTPFVFVRPSLDLVGYSVRLASYGSCMSGDRVPASPYCLYDIPSNDVNAETSLSPFSFVEVISPLKFVTPMVSCGGSRLICECQRSCAGGKTCSNSPDFLLSLPTTPLNSNFRYRGVFSCNSFLGLFPPPFVLRPDQWCRCMGCILSGLVLLAVLDGRWRVLGSALAVLRGSVASKKESRWIMSCDMLFVHSSTWGRM